LSLAGVEDGITAEAGIIAVAAAVITVTTTMMIAMMTTMIRIMFKG
jgi:hypothetical protein